MTYDAIDVQRIVFRLTNHRHIMKTVNNGNTARIDTEKGRRENVSK
jgi:hypothetical protein